jgi:hypothetical protein
VFLEMAGRYELSDFLIASVARFTPIFVAISNTKLHSKVEYGCCAPPLDEEKIMGKVTCAAPHLSIDEVKGQ